MRSMCITRNIVQATSILSLIFDSTFPAVAAASGSSSSPQSISSISSTCCFNSPLHNTSASTYCHTRSDNFIKNQAPVFTALRPVLKKKHSTSPVLNMGMESTSNANDKESEQTNSNYKIHTHYVFLIHGWLGNFSEMSYLETSINRAAATYNSESDTSATTDADNNAISKNARLVTFSAKANDKKTTDGIAPGGTRLAEEVTNFIKKDIHQHMNEFSSDLDLDTEHHVSISFVGNSLGGLYARYALSKIPTHLKIDVQGVKEGKEASSQKNLSINLHREIFATTATPHLGVASHTYLPLPRALEHIVGRTLQKTGKDLFRIDKDDLIYQMCTDYETYLKPLSMFRERIAYINAFGTDFQVPTGTAGFLNRNSTYPHCILEASVDGNASKRDSHPPFIVAVASTTKNQDILKEKTDSLKCKKHAMSIKLDGSGWRKVFVDVREYLPTPGFSLPSFMKKSSRIRWNEFVRSKESEVRSEGNVEGEGEGDGKNVVYVQSRELEKLMTGSDRVEIPVGHQVMVANSKSEAYSSFTKQGRPVMDHLAKEIVQSLFR